MKSNYIPSIKFLIRKPKDNINFDFTLKRCATLKVAKGTRSLQYFLLEFLTTQIHAA